MQTRSQTKSASTLADIPSKKIVEYRPQEIKLVAEYAVEIDFDEASRHWNANKKRLTNGCYQYVCGTPLANGLFCKRKMCKTSQLCSQCTKNK